MSIQSRLTHASASVSANKMECRGVWWKCSNTVPAPIPRAVAPDCTETSSTSPNAPTASRATLTVLSRHASATTTIHNEFRQPRIAVGRKYAEDTLGNGVRLVSRRYDDADSLDYRSHVQVCNRQWPA